MQRASDLLPRLPMVIPDHSPELTAAYHAVQHTKFEVAKLLHAGDHAEAGVVGGAAHGRVHPEPPWRVHSRRHHDPGQGRGS